TRRAAQDYEKDDEGEENDPGKAGSIFLEGRLWLLLLLVAGAEQPLRESGQAPMGHLADARLAIPGALGRLRRAASQAIAQAKHRATAVRELAEQGVEVGAQIGALLGRRLGFGEQLEDGAVHQVPEPAAVLAPVDDAAVRQGRQQPGFRIADAPRLRDHDEEGLLQEVVRVLERDAMAPEYPLELGLDVMQDLFERRLLHGWYLVAHARSENHLYVYKQKYTNLVSPMSRGNLRQLGNKTACPVAPAPSAAPGARPRSPTTALRSS